MFLSQAIKTLLFAILLFSYNKLFAQLNIEESTYRTFNGRIVNVYIIQGVYVVLNIDKNEISTQQLSDVETMKKLIDRCDQLYKFYKDNLGIEPPGGNPKYNYKCDVYFGQPSCGAACGRVGSKGIECSDFTGKYTSLKYNHNVSKDVMIGYEFGRNFFTFSSKILFPLSGNPDEKNGGFAEAFANIMYSYAFEKILVNPSERIFNEALLYPKWARSKFIAYVNDTVANPYNSLARADLLGIRDANRGFEGYNFYSSSYDGHAILEGIISTYGREKLFPNFFNELKKLPDAKTREDAMSNIAMATSITLGYNLNSFFRNVLKFNLNTNAELIISKFPNLPSQLIKYEKRLWFITPFHTVRLNLRSTNYKTDGYVYKIFKDNTLISSSLDGNNEIQYDVLGSNNEVKILCALTDLNGKIIDSFSTILAKRHNINLFDYPEDWYAYYLANNVTSSYISKEKEFILSGFDNNVTDQGYLFYNLIISGNRKLKFTTSAKNIGNYTPEVVSNFCQIQFSTLRNTSGSSRLGYDIGQNDGNKFYDLSFADNTESFMYRDLVMGRIHVANYGKGVKSIFKNLFLRDETDTDGDGKVDFEDSCPTIVNPLPPKIIRDLDNNLVSNSENVTWYRNGIQIPEVKSKFKPNEKGLYAAILVEKGCKSEMSNTVYMSTSSTGEYLRAYPNPTHGDMYLDFILNSFSEIYVSIIDMTGKLIKGNLKISSGDKINSSNIPAGNYTLIARDASEKILATQKFIRL